MDQSNALLSPAQRMDAAKKWLLGPEMQQNIARALPRHISAERVAQLFFVEARKTPRLLECTGESLLGAVMEVSKLGLELGTLGHAWILPFKVKGKLTATVIIGYKGMLALAWRSDKISNVYGHVVRDGDFFEYTFGSDPVIRHTPADFPDRGRPTHAYAGCTTVTGGQILEVMAIEECEKVRSRSRSGSKGPWVDDYDAMCVKTAMRRALKLAPCSTELARAITVDEAQDARGDQHLEASLEPIPAAGDGDGDA